MNYLFDFDISRNLFNYLNNFFYKYFFINDLFFISRHFNELINNSFHNFLYLNINILLNFNLNYFFLNHWNLNYFLNLFNFLFNNYFRYNSFNNLWNLDYFFNNSWHNDDFFNYFLYLNNFWNFNHFLDYFFDWNSNFFNSINIPNNLDNLFFNIFDGFRYINIMINNSLNLNGFRLFNNYGVSKIYLFDDSILDFLDNGLLYDLLNANNSFMDDGDLYYSFNFSWYLSNDLDRNLNLPNYLFNNLLNSYFLNNSFNLFNLLNYAFYYHDFLYYLWHFNNSFNCLNDRYRLFNYSINYLVSNFNMIVNLLCCYNLFLWHNYFHDFLYLDDFWYFNNSVNNLLYNIRNLFNNFNDSFCWNNFL